LDKAGALLSRASTFGESLLAPVAVGDGISREKRLGLLYEVIRNGEELAEKARRAIKEEIGRGVLPELPNGKTLVLKTRAMERLSKTEFVRTYGKVAAERLFEKWRKDGALAKKEEFYLQPVDD
jgi:hypothetical protein